MAGNVPVPTPRSSSSYWQCDWTLRIPQKDSLALSEFIPIPGFPSFQKACRLGAQADGNGSLARLCCYANNRELRRLGFETTDVTCTIQEHQADSTDLKQLDLVDENDLTNVLFQCHLKDSLVKSGKAVDFTFRMCLSPVVSSYKVDERFDTLHGPQLWASALNTEATDVEFKVGESTTFSAHKFILALRSPVFRAMFQTDPNTERVQVDDDVEPELFEQFLRFVYTGQLAGPVTKELGSVAQRYQLETLSLLCKAVENDKVPVDQESNTEPRHHQGHLSVAGLLFGETFHVPNYGQHEGVPSDSFIKYTIEPSAEISSRFTVTAQVSWVNELPFSVVGIDLAVSKRDQIVTRLAMSPAVTVPREVSWKFTADIDDWDALDFTLYRASHVKNFEYQPRDSSFCQDLYVSALLRDQTDVEFLARIELIPAHRVIVAARCPSLAALIPAGSSSTASSAFVSVNVDSETFRDLHRFLYTGTFSRRIRDGRILEAAKLYGIETLLSLAIAASR